MCKGKCLAATLLCVCLFAALLPAPALAADALLPKNNAYPDHYYTDVSDGDWYAAPVRLCYETGLMNGTGGNSFSPGKTMTVGEVAALSARLLEALGGETIVSATPVPGETRPWYQDYVDYLSRAVDARSGNWAYVYDLLAHPTEDATRYGFLSLLSLAATEKDDLLPAINAIQTLPDTQDATVLSFYNAGILTGTDVYGTFNADKTLTRAEAAAMLARVMDPDQRQRFAPQVRGQATATEPEKKPTLSYEEELMQTEAVRINGATVTFAQFIDTLNACVSEVDNALKANSGTGLDWNTKYSDVDDLELYFKQMATGRLVESTLVATQARALGCSADALPSVLTPDPSKALDNIYCAKHILVDDAQTAQGIIALLQNSPSMTTFNLLLSQYGTDPGMTSYPNGYLFTNGDMVEEFENAVKALAIGSCSSAPVKSQFGYHVILRLDPTSYPGWQQAVQEMKYAEYVSQWMSSATVTTNDAELDRLDVQARYAQYLASLGG